MIHVLGVESYAGFSTWMDGSSAVVRQGAQPVYVGRLRWPGEDEPVDAVIKLYEADSCGVANEVIGYATNDICGVDQPIKGAVLILPREALPRVEYDIRTYVDGATDLALCWATSLEQNAKPFKFVRRLSTFSEHQAQAFYQSNFCKMLAGVDHGTGNNDRHDGNFMYIDDLKYKAIDQGCVGGGRFWHSTWPDADPQNEILKLVDEVLKPSQRATWHADALLAYQRIRENWSEISVRLPDILQGLLQPDHVNTIISYMEERIEGHSFENCCGSLF